MVKNKNHILLFAMIILILLVTTACADQNSYNDRSPDKTERSSYTQHNLTNNQDQAKNSENAEEAITFISAKVTYVSDGDTFHINLNGRDEKVRLIGVNTPEIAHPEQGIAEQPYGKEAKDYTTSRLIGKTVYLTFDVSNRDKYGRLLAYVWTSKPVNDSEKEIRTKMFNAELLLNGYAQVMTVPPNVKYADLFVKFQQEARSKGEGLWGIKVKTEAYYVASKKGTVFHRPDCKWAKQIKSYNLIKFKTRDEALDEGYNPCRICNP